jgi:hypothetical protein
VIEGLPADFPAHGPSGPDRPPCRCS